MLNTKEERKKLNWNCKIRDNLTSENLQEKIKTVNQIFSHEISFFTVVWEKLAKEKT